MVVVIASPHRSHVAGLARCTAALRVLAIAVAVLSLGGMAGARLASRVVGASATAAIAASSAEWRAAGAIRELERASDAAWVGSDVDGLAPALVPAGVSWELGGAALARVIDWAPTSTEAPPARRVVTHLARGPPADLS